MSKIVVSSRWKLNDTTYKYFCGYLNNDGIIKSLCVILPQMNGYIKYFDDGGKFMSFVIDDEKVYEKYDEIWNVVKGLLKLKFAASPIRDDKYILAKLIIFRKKNLTTFNNNNDIVPTEKNHYISIPAIWATFSSPNLMERFSPHWIRFNKNSCYKNLIYFKCVYWYFYWV